VRDRNLSHHSQMKSVARFALLALVLVIVAMVSALTAMRFAIHGQEVAVPALVGLTPAEAERAAAGSGLQMSIERQYYSPNVPDGRIMSQLPLPGTKVRRGWEVRVAQSLGPTRVTIPDVTGQSEHAAELNIRRRGLDIASMADMEIPGIPSDQVVAQSPPANTPDVLAPNVSLLVTTDSQPQAFVMPSFIGQPLGTVSQTLEDAGFKLGNVTVAPPPIAEVTDANAPSTGVRANSPPTSPAPASPATTPAASVTTSTPPTTPPPQPTPASIVVLQSPAPGQKIVAGAVVNLQVR
jgi:eukaryotic-like serine/threonine-protein kinase